MTANELLRYGKILSDRKYEINGHDVRTRRVKYAVGDHETVWTLTMIDGEVYKLERIAVR